MHSFSCGCMHEAPKINQLFYLISTRRRKIVFFSLKYVIASSLKFFCSSFYFRSPPTHPPKKNKKGKRKQSKKLVYAYIDIDKLLFSGYKIVLKHLYYCAGLCANTWLKPQIKRS